MLPWCTLDHALRAAPAGSLVLVRGGDYGGTTVENLRPARRVTFRAVGGGVTLRGLTLEGTQKLRFEGFRFTGKAWVYDSSGIQIVGNDFSPQGVVVRGSRHVLLERNRFHHLTYEGSKVGAGYAIVLMGAPVTPGAPPSVSNVTISDNKFSWIPADAIQMGTVNDVLVEGNEFDHVTPFIKRDEHADAIQMHGTARRVTIRGNYFHDQPRALIAKRRVFRGLKIENNLMVRLNGIALNIYDAPGVRIVNNTIWDTTIGIRFRDLPEVPGAMTGAVLVNNIIDKLAISPAHVRVEDHNLIGKRKPGYRYGPHDLFGAPGFVSPRQRDFRLRPGSRAIDSGLFAYSPPRDRLGRKRVDAPKARNRGGGRKRFVDRGAYEFKPLQPRRRSRSR